MQLRPLRGGAVLFVGLVVAGCTQTLPSTPITAAESYLSGLKAQGSDVFYAAKDREGNVVYLAASTIETGCANDQAQRANPVALSTCVGAYLASKIWQRESDAPLLQRVLVRDTEHRDGYREITSVERFRGYVVKSSELELTFDPNDRLVEVVGSPSRQLSFNAGDDITSFASEEDAAKWAERHLDKKLHVVERYFDPATGSVVLHAADQDHDHMRHHIDELRRKVVATHDLTYDSHPLAEQDVIHSKYDNSISAPNGNRQSSVRMTRRRDGDRCQFSLDHGSDHDQGEPKLGIYVDGQYRPDASRTLRVTRNCETTTAFRFAPNESVIVDDAVNAYFWLHDLSAFSRSQWAAYDARYPWRSYDPENLRVVVAPSDLCAGAAIACAQPGFSEYKIKLPVDTGSTRSLGTLAHEFGHIIHFMYDRTPTSFRGLAVNEGFANHNELRYALFRHAENANRPFDQMDTITYEARDHAEYPSLRRGIFEPSTSPNAATGALIYDEQAAICSPESTTHPHRCGDVLAALYWQLAWNECRIGYRSKAGTFCADGQTIVESSQDPVRLANVAFTSAIRKMKDHHTMTRFFDFVSWRYSRFLMDGQIGAGDFQRVLATLNHHCLGWDHECDVARILPLHRLPVRRAARSSLDSNCQADKCEVLVLATEGQRSPSLDTIAHTRPGTTIPINDRYVRFEDAMDSLSFAVNLPVDGLYEFQLLTRTDGACCDSVMFSTDGGLALPWSLANDTPGRWRWSAGSSRLFRSLGKGQHVFKLGHRENLDVEALLIRLRADSDGDGRADNADNCPSTPNLNQANQDGDPRGDVCDKCPDVFSFLLHADQDGDGIGDDCDRDKNGDGIPDALMEIEELKNLGSWP